MLSSRVYPSTRSGTDNGYRGFNDFESEIVSIAGPLQAANSNDLEHLQHLQSVLGDVLDKARFRFSNPTIEAAYVNSKCEQRQSEEFDFVERTENLLAIIYALFFLVIVTGSPSSQGKFPFWLYILSVVVSATTLFAVKFVEKFFVRDSSLVTGVFTLCVSLGYILIAIDDISENANQIVAELSVLVVGHLAGVAILSPVKTSEFVLLGLTTVVVYLVECVAVLIVSGQGDSAALGTILLSVSVLSLIIRYCILKDNLSRRTWIMLSQNAEYRKRLLEAAVKNRRRGPMNSRQSEEMAVENSQASEFFKRLNENQTILRLRIDPSDLDLRDFLGRGAMGEVFEAYYMDAPVALKRLPPNLLNKTSCEQFIAEVKLLKGLRHPNIVQLMGVTWSEKSEMVGMVLELMSRGSLRSVLQDKNLQLSWEDPKCKLAIDIAKAMAYLHGMHIIHRDLKTENVLVSSTFTSKVSDFGTSKLLQSGGDTTPVGTPFWRAPEMIRAERYTTKADVYSFAIMLLEIATEENPFEHMSPLAALEFPHKVAHSDYRLPIPDSVPGGIRKIISQCWDPNPNKRPPFALIRRKLQKFLDEVSAEDENKDEQHLLQLMTDQIIMSGNSERKKYTDGDIIIEYGDVGEECYIVTRGVVEVFIPETEEIKFDSRDIGTKWKQVDTVNVGYFFGEMGMYAKTERSATCVAKGDVTCILFGREMFMSLDSEFQSIISRKILSCLQKFNGEGPEQQDDDGSIVEHRRELQSKILKRVDTISNGTIMRMTAEELDNLDAETGKSLKEAASSSNAKSMPNLRQPEETEIDQEN